LITLGEDDNNDDGDAASALGMAIELGAMGRQKEHDAPSSGRMEPHCSMGDASKCGKSQTERGQNRGIRIPSH